MLDLAAASAGSERGRGGPTGGTGHGRRPDEMAMRKTLLLPAPTGRRGAPPSQRRRMQCDCLTCHGLRIASP